MLSELLKDWELLQGSASAQACWAKPFLSQKCLFNSSSLLSPSCNCPSCETSCSLNKLFCCFVWVLF